MTIALRYMKRLALTAALAFLLVGVAWCCIPMSPEMRTRPSYFLWSQGLRPLTPESLSAFTRDRAFRTELHGQTLAVLEPLFPDMHDGSEYPPESYRGQFGLSINDWNGEPAEFLWLTRDGVFGYVVLHRDQRIVQFQWIKG